MNRLLRTRQRPGFTLADVMIASLIMGILAAVATPKFFQTLGRSRADAAAMRVKADLTLARQTAITTSSPLTVQFSPSNEDYVIPGLPDLNHPGQNYSTDLSANPYRAEIDTALFGGDSDVQFDRYGQPDSGGTVTLQSGGYTQTVTVDPDTGRATIP